MNIKQRLKLRRQLNISASELELIELIDAHTPRLFSLSQLGDELMITKRGIDKMAIRLVSDGLLYKTAGKLFISDLALDILHPVQILPASPIQSKVIDTPIEPASSTESVTIPVDSGKVCITIEITYKAQR